MRPDPACGTVHRRPGPARRPAGFSMIEMVVVMVILGIIGASVGVFINNPVRAYFETIGRATLTDAGDLVVRRMIRELQTAVPNSARMTSSSGTVYLEFVPIVDAGRYRIAASNGNDPTGIDPLDFSNPADNSFQVLGPPVNAPSGARMVIMNLGYGSFSLYGGGNVRSLSAYGSALSTIQYVPNGAWPADSPTHRFFLFGTAVTYACTPVAGGTGVIRRYAGYAVQASQPASAAAAPLSTASSSLVLDDVSACGFTLGSAQEDLNSAQISLQLSRNGETVTLYGQVNAPNSP